MDKSHDSLPAEASQSQPHSLTPQPGPGPDTQASPAAPAGQRDQAAAASAPQSLKQEPVSGSAPTPAAASGVSTPSTAPDATHSGTNTPTSQLPTAAAPTSTTPTSAPQQLQPPQQPLLQSAPAPQSSAGAAPPQSGFSLPSISQAYPLPSFAEDEFQNRTQLPRLTQPDDERDAAHLPTIVPPSQQAPLSQQQAPQQSQPSQPPQLQQSQQAQPAQQQPQPQVSSPSQGQAQQGQPRPPQAPQHQQPQVPQGYALQPPQTQSPTPQAPSQVGTPLHAQPHAQTHVPTPPQHSSQQMVMGYMPMYQYGHQFQHTSPMPYLQQPGQPGQPGQPQHQLAQVHQQHQVPQHHQVPQPPQQPQQPPHPPQQQPQLQQPAPAHHQQPQPRPDSPQQQQAQLHQPQAQQPQPQQPQPQPQQPQQAQAQPPQHIPQAGQPPAAGQPPVPQAATPGAQQVLQQPSTPQSQVAAVAADYRPLNVKDALTYLEQVKLHFVNQPDVYNHFLDIMKDFKSHSIDTPGVIDRVSSLFRGHANLIQGFNTFLPAGYSIECSLDPNDPNPIRVTTPMGSQTLPHMLALRQAAQQPQQVQQQVQQAQQVQQQRQQTNANAHLHVATQQPVPYYAVPQGPMPPQQLPPHQQPPPGVGMEQRQGPVEFSHAISYVNKIKNHFTSQPEIYKQFLEILQTYQREQLRISEVYAQVRHLFKDAPELLEGFKNFLPDTGPGGEEGAGIPGGVVGGPGAVRLPPVGSFGPTPTQATNGTAVAGAGAGTGAGLGAGQPVMGHPPPQQSRSQPPVSNSRRGAGPIGIDDIVPTAKPVGARTRGNLNEEIAFFDKVKRLLPKPAYHEFLKTLNLFTQRIVDVPTLVTEVEPYLAQHPDLMAWFKQFVGYEGKPLHIENIAAKKHLIDLSQCRSYGRSYRLLPKAEQYMPCSGRDELGWEVFNDEWVGHPTWASEDSGFVAHRKNQYEEILFRVEEERHEYDHYIGSNQRTIQVLETIANRMASMTPAELAVFKLPEGLGHGSKIYQKVIRKVYDRKNGSEVIEALHENPGAAVPVVLRRLKQKDEEWRRAHREWNKVWRAAEQKAYYKSLDHLGLTFKQADRKQLTPRSLLAEIMAVKAEQSAKRKLAATNLQPLPTPKEQLDFVVSDYGVLDDLKGLITRYIDNRPTMSANDKDLSKRFLSVFIDEFFSEQPISGPQIATVLKRDSPEESAEVEAVQEAVEAGADAMTAEAEAVQKEIEDVEMTDVTDAPATSQSWLKLERTSPPLSEKPSPRKQFNLFGNTPVYLFMRLFEIIYSRLAEVKGVEGIVSKTLAESRRTPFAVDLGLYDTKLETLGLRFEPNDVYGQTLSLCYRLIEEEVEPQWFEEALRQAYRNRAYKLYTIDKALQSLVKQLHAVVTDEGVLDALSLWEVDRSKPTSSVRSQIELRMLAKQAISGVSGAQGLSNDSYVAAESTEPLFRIAWTPAEHRLSFQSLGPFDITLKGAMDDQRKWEYYVTSYTMSLPTEGVPLDQIRAPVLQRVLPEDVQDYKFEVVAEDLQARIAFNSFKMFFEPGTADYLVNIHKGGDAARAKAQRQKRWKEAISQAEEALRISEQEALEAEKAAKNDPAVYQEEELAEVTVAANAAEADADADESAMDVDTSSVEAGPTPAQLAAEPRLELQSVAVVLPQ